MTVGIQAKGFNLGFIRPENLVSHGLGVLKVPFGKLQAGCRMPFPEEWLPSGHSTINGLIGGVLQRWLSFWKVCSLYSEVGYAKQYFEKGNP